VVRLTSPVPPDEIPKESDGFLAVNRLPWRDGDVLGVNG